MLTPEEQELLETAKLFYDLVKLYDSRLVQLGEKPELVYSDIHKAGMIKAERIIRDWEFRQIGESYEEKAKEKSREKA